MPELSETDILVWFGDFNYRIDTSFEQAMEWIKDHRYDKLIDKDQLRYEMACGRTFPGMREGGIEFPPTYKFDRGSQGLNHIRPSQIELTPLLLSLLVQELSMNLDEIVGSWLKR